MQPPVHISFQLDVASETFSFKVHLQWSGKVEASRRKVWQMGRTFPSKVLQELDCPAGCIGGGGVVMEKGHFPLFTPDGFFHMVQCCVVAVCISCYPVDQKLRQMPCASQNSLNNTFTAYEWVLEF